MLMTKMESKGIQDSVSITEEDTNLLVLLTALAVS